MVFTNNSLGAGVLPDRLITDFKLFQGTQLEKYFFKDKIYQVHSNSLNSNSGVQVLFNHPILPVSLFQHGKSQFSIMST